MEIILIMMMMVMMVMMMGMLKTIMRILMTMMVMMTMTRMGMRWVSSSTVSIKYSMRRCRVFLVKYHQSHTRRTQRFAKLCA